MDSGSRILQYDGCCRSSLSMALQVMFLLPLFMSIGVPNYGPPDFQQYLDPVGFALTTSHYVTVKYFGLGKLIYFLKASELHLPAALICASYSAVSATMRKL